MKRYILIFGIASSLFGQKPDSALTAKIRYGGLQQMGIAFTEHSSNSLFTMINGVRYKKFFLGLGVDANFRRNSFFNNMNTSAFFLDSRYYLGKKGSFFCRLDGGANLITEPRSREGDGSFYYQQSSYKFHPGYFGAFGAGIKAKLGNEVFYTVDVIYVMKQLLYDHHSTDWRGINKTDKYDFRQSIIQVNLGLELF